MMKKRFLPLLFLVAMTLAGADFNVKEITLENNNYHTVESDTLIVYFNRVGGRIDRIYYKPARQELVNGTYRGVFT